MNWENIDKSLEESKVQASRSTSNTKMEQEKQNENELIQLNKFQDPSKNPDRQAILAILARFGDIFTTNNNTNIMNNIFTDDCDFFLFSSTGRIPVKYSLHSKDLFSLYSVMQIQERRVRETYIDLEKMTAFQFSNFHILYQDEANPVDEIVAEIFTIKENKINKYRAFLCQMTPDHGDSDPFEVTRKDRVLAMVKQINYALAGSQPNFEKVAVMLHENVKYKVWSWDSQKCFILGKHDFVENFETMQENLMIKSIVPYEIYTESQGAVGTYVYHLEGISDKYKGKKYVWLCTSLYVFDDDYKITRVSQQGELYLEGEASIQFEVHSRERLIQKVQNLYMRGPTLDLFYGDVFALNCILYSFGPEGSPAIGCHRGTAFVDKNKEWINKSRTEPPPRPIDERKRIKLTESFFDCSDSSYDIVLLIYKIGHMLNPSQQNTHIEGGTIVLSMLKLEHGKIVKGYGFISSVPEPIPSPFGHPEFEDEIFLPKNSSL